LDKHAIAQEINICFTKLGEQKIGNPIEAMECYAGKDNPQPYFSHPATTESVIKIIDKLKKLNDLWS